MQCIVFVPPSFDTQSLSYVIPFVTRAKNTFLNVVLYSFLSHLNIHYQTLKTIYINMCTCKNMKYFLSGHHHVTCTAILLIIMHSFKGLWLHCILHQQKRVSTSLHFLFVLKSWIKCFMNSRTKISDNDDDDSANKVMPSNKKWMQQQWMNIKGCLPFFCNAV